MLAFSLTSTRRRLKNLAMGVYDFFIGDDIKTLQDPNALKITRTLQKRLLKGEKQTFILIPNDGKVFETLKISDNKQSYTVWEKYINAKGETKILGHRTHLNDGQPIHWHEKIPHNNLEINLRNTNNELYYQHIRQLTKQYKL